MTEQELREKIFNIVREFNVQKRRYSTHTEPSDDDELADALIAAEIGDVKEAELERKAYEVASNQYRIWFEEQKHRAEVAERALLLACANVVKDEKDDVDIELLVRVVYDKYLKQAEQLAEEKKDEQS